MPLAWIYKQIVSLRNKFFDWHILISLSYPIPIISIGNLTVGGTGKTPHTEYLIELLKDKFPIAVLSRGYKRKSRGFILGNSQTLISQIGDEPYQMLHKYPEISVAVDESRCHGVECLMREKSNLQVILLDDAFQHRYIKPGIDDLRKLPVGQPAIAPALREAGGDIEKQRLGAYEGKVLLQRFQIGWREDIGADAGDAAAACLPQDDPVSGRECRGDRLGALRIEGAYDDLPVLAVQLPEGRWAHLAQRIECPVELGGGREAAACDDVMDPGTGV